MGLANLELANIIYLLFIQYLNAESYVGKIRDENDQDEPLPKKSKKNRTSSSLLEAFKVKTEK